MGALDRAARGRLWRRSRNDVYVQYDGFVSMLSGAIHRRQLQRAAALYIEHLHLILRRLQVGSEPWINSLWRRLCAQYQSNGVGKICEAMKANLTRGGSSCIYHLVSLSCNKPYFGLVEERPSIRRLIEHWQELAAREPSEEKYRGMQRQAKPWEWLLIPTMTSMSIVPLCELKRLEQGEIHAFPNNWNSGRG